MLNFFTSSIRKISIQQYNRCISIVPLSRLNSKYSSLYCQDHRFLVRRDYSMNMKGKKYIYAHKFEGMPKVTDLQLVEEEIPPVKDGGILQCR